MLNMQAAEMPAMLSAHLTLIVEFKYLRGFLSIKRFQSNEFIVVLSMKR